LQLTDNLFVRMEFEAGIVHQQGPILDEELEQYIVLRHTAYRPKNMESLFRKNHHIEPKILGSMNSILDSPDRKRFIDNLSRKNGLA